MSSCSNPRSWRGPTGDDRSYGRTVRAPYGNSCVCASTGSDRGSTMMDGVPQPPERVRPEEGNLCIGQRLGPVCAETDHIRQRCSRRHHWRLRHAACNSTTGLTERGPHHSVVGMGTAHALISTTQPQLTLNHLIPTSPFVGTSTRCADNEGSAYVASDDSLWMATTTATRCRGRPHDRGAAAEDRAIGLHQRATLRRRRHRRSGRAPKTSRRSPTTQTPTSSTPSPGARARPRPLPPDT